MKIEQTNFFMLSLYIFLSQIASQILIFVIFKHSLTKIDIDSDIDRYRHSSRYAQQQTRLCKQDPEIYFTLSKSGHFPAKNCDRLCGFCPSRDEYIQ